MIREDEFRTVLGIVTEVYAEEAGLPSSEITPETKLSPNSAGMMTISRMAAAIPGGGANLVVDFPAMCTVGELVEKCIEATHRNLDL